MCKIKATKALASPTVKIEEEIVKSGVLRLDN